MSPATFHRPGLVAVHPVEVFDMEQLDLLSAVPVNILEPDNLDPAKYAADRGECKCPTLHPQSAYRYGCRCIGCRKYRSAWSARIKQGPLPCSFAGCTAPRRRVQAARYCEQHASSVRYALQPSYRKPAAEFKCDLCGSVQRLLRNKRRPYCGSCNERFAGVVAQAAAHRVDVATLTAWIKRGTCGLCERPLYLGKGKGGAQGFAVDHDHQCCDLGRNSCGRCVRDLLCTSCNVSLGHVEAVANRAGINTVLRYLYGRQA
jgi:hypothetical protein